jgi:hypothetical protein
MNEQNVDDELNSPANVNDGVAYEGPHYQPIPYTSIIGTAVSAEPRVATSIPFSPAMAAPVTVVPQVSTTIPYAAPVVAPDTQPVPSSANGGSLAALLNHAESEHFRTCWNAIQGKFVDDPRSAVQQADALVTEVSAQITQMFADEHSSLEAQWNEGSDVSTEDLRKALQRYRSFFNRLVV